VTVEHLAFSVLAASMEAAPGARQHLPVQVAMKSVRRSIEASLGRLAQDECENFLRLLVLESKQWDAELRRRREARYGR